MQIQRVIEEPMGACEEVRFDRKEATKTATTRETMQLADSTANRSFLHGSSDRTAAVANKCANDEQRSVKDRTIAYATIDRIALKRARLPLQLVPIDDNNGNSTIDRKDRINAEKKNNASRKSCPRRPSFKVRPGVPVSGGQWKSRALRPVSRGGSSIGGIETVSKELVSRLLIFENIIRSNSNNNLSGSRGGGGGGLDARSLIVESSAEFGASSDKNFVSIHAVDSIIGDSTSTVDEKRGKISIESEDPELQSAAENVAVGENSAARNSAEISSRTENSSSNDFRKILPVIAKENEDFFTQLLARRNSSGIELQSLSECCSTSTGSNGSISTIKSKRPKSESTFARSVFDYVPIANKSRRAKKSGNNNSTKSRKSEKIEEISSLRTSKSKSFSREELRHSISLPSNFVHLASATNSKLLPNGDSSGRIINHEEKRAELRYLGSGNNRENELEIARRAEGKKMLRNSREDKTTYVEIKTTTTSDDENRKNLDEILSGESTKVSSSGAIQKNEEQQAKPEVVKTSENEGNDNYRHLRGEQTAPIYEAMAEFSIRPCSPNSPAEIPAANASFLWRTRTTRTADSNYVDPRRNDDICRSKHEIELQNIDYSTGQDSGDLYDDVGLSRDHCEEDLYDDVGLPLTKSVRGSSTCTVFEEIDVGSTVDDLYDDVLPGVERSSSCSREIEGRDEKLEKSPPANRCSSLSLESAEPSETHENPYLSIGNDYSSVEEGLDEFEDQTDDGLYDDVELPSQERVNSLYAGSTSGSQLGSTCNGKESEWEDLEEAAPVLPAPKRSAVVLRHGESQASSSKKRTTQRWSRRVRRQKSKASRKNPGIRVGSSAPRGTSAAFPDTASDDSNYETLFSFPSDEFSSGSEDEKDNDSSTNPSILNEHENILENVENGFSEDAPSRPVPPPPRESSLTESFGKRMKMLRRTWSITKGSLGRMRRRTSNVAETETSVEDVAKYQNCEHQQQQQTANKYFSFKKHFKKSTSGLSTFYLDNSSEERLARNNNCTSKEQIYGECGNNSWYTGTDYWKTGVSQQSHRDDVDHYSMLDEEPLYQFYAAAAARVAFESDSEGYEEVEDPAPSPSAVDLAKPGHRTLWCQTPQVINSALLQRLTSDEKKMQEAKFEIFTSEASYLNSLRVLVDEFLNDHELVHEILTPSEREKLFGGVPSVLLASERLLAELETVWREDVMLRGLPDVLLNYAQRSSSVYVAYCSNQVSIDTTVKELSNKKGSKFVDALKRIESHSACQNLSLHSFLMLPMQRVTRLPLLADAVLSRVPSDNKDERNCWECVLSQLSQVVMECNEGARAAGRLAEMEALERKLEYSSKVPPITLRDRFLVRRGPVVQMLAKPDAEYKLTFGKKHHKASLYLLLLTDYLLIAKPKSNTNEETYTVTDTCKRSLVALEKVTEDSPFAGRHAMVLTLLENYSGRHVEYILTCKNATERERWLDAVSPPKPSLVGETLYETWDCPQVMALYPYAAAQPDELTLQPGDVINVLRKMTDGWHLGEKLLGGEQGWFPGNYAKEVASEHVRARNLRQRHRLLALSASVLQQRAKQASRLH